MQMTIADDKSLIAGGPAMRRRQFLGIVGRAAAWPFAARAQQQAAVPVIGFLRITSAADAERLVAALRQGLRESA
jgi:hypothetical protein